MTVVDIAFEQDDWAAAGVTHALAEAACAAAFREAAIAVRDDAEVSVLFTDDRAVAALNARWRGKPAATNVLSFPAVEPGRLATSPMLGDIVLGYETCRREADEEGRPLTDHVAHLVVHGALHLLGFDHATEAEAERMEALERRALAGLGVPDPYAGSEP